MNPISNLWPTPKNLTGYGRSFYRRVGRHLADLGILTDLDRESFVSMCGAFHLMQMSLDSVTDSGLNVPGSKHEIKKNPALTTYKNASDIFHRLSRRFYLTPLDRRGVELKRPEPVNEKARFFEPTS